jgi:hypothetical protein
MVSTKYKHFQNWPIKHFLPLLSKTAMLCWKRCFAYTEWEWSTIHTVYTRIYIGTKNHFSGFAGWIGAFSSISSTGNSVRYSIPAPCQNHHLSRFTNIMDLKSYRVHWQCVHPQTDHATFRPTLSVHTTNHMLWEFAPVTFFHIHFPSLNYTDKRRTFC